MEGQLADLVMMQIECVVAKAQWENGNVSKEELLAVLWRYFDRAEQLAEGES